MLVEQIFNCNSSPFLSVSHAELKNEHFGEVLKLSRF